MATNKKCRVSSSALIEATLQFYALNLEVSLTRHRTSIDCACAERRDEEGVCIENVFGRCPSFVIFTYFVLEIYVKDKFVSLISSEVDVY